MLLIIFVLPLFTTMFTQIAQAQEETETMNITTDWISIGLTDWNGYDISNSLTYDGKLKFQKGGYSIQSSINHGRIEWNEDTQRGIYLTELVGSVYALGYTDLLTTDLVKYTPTDKTQRYLNLITYTSGPTSPEWSYSETYLREHGWANAEKDTFSSRWSSLEITGFNQRDYNGLLGVQIKVDDTTLPNGAKPGDTVDLFGMNYRINNYTITIPQVRVSEIEMSTIADYNVQYASDIGQQLPNPSNTINSGYSNPSAPGKTDAKEICGDAESNVNSRITSLGIHDLSRVSGITENIYGSLSGREALDAGSVGQVYDDSNDQDAAGNVFQFSQMMRIKPRLEMDVNNFNVEKTNLAVDTADLWAGIRRDWDSQTYPKTQVIGFHEYNYVVKIKYEFSIYIYADIETEGDLETNYLENPSTRHGDALYNNYMTQDKVNKPFTDPWGEFLVSIGDWWNNLGKAISDWWNNLGKAIADWWTQYTWIVVLIAVAVILTVTLIIIRKFKKPRGMTNMPQLNIITGGK